MANLRWNTDWALVQIQIVVSLRWGRTNHFPSPWIKTKFRLYIHFSDWFVNKRNYVWCQINGKNVITIQFGFDITRFRTDFSVCSYSRYIGFRSFYYVIMERIYRWIVFDFVTVFCFRLLYIQFNSVQIYNNIKQNNDNLKYNSSIEQITSDSTSAEL